MLSSEHPAELSFESNSSSFVSEEAPHTEITRDLCHNNDCHLEQEPLDSSASLQVDRREMIKQWDHEAICNSILKLLHQKASSPQGDLLSYLHLFRSLAHLLRPWITSQILLEHLLILANCHWDFRSISFELEEHLMETLLREFSAAQQPTMAEEENLEAILEIYFSTICVAKLNGNDQAAQCKFAEFMSLISQ